MSNRENETKGNWWTTGGMSFRLRLTLGIIALVVVILFWVANSTDMPIEAMILLPMLLFVYLTPTLIALGRRHKALGAILALNIFLGWSLLGWVAALVWALTNPKPDQPVVVNTGPSNMADELAKLAELRDKGVLTEEEFQARKAALLS